MRDMQRYEKTRYASAAGRYNLRRFVVKTGPVAGSCMPVSGETAKNAGETTGTRRIPLPSGAIPTCYYSVPKIT